MSKAVLDDAEVIINGTDLSAFVMRCTLNTSRDLQESSTMGTATKTREKGLKDWSVEIQFAQDFDSGSVDDTLRAIDESDSAVTISVMANKTAGIGVNNPRRSGSAHLASYPPLGNAVGELQTTTVTFNAAGNLTRSTS